MRLIKFGEPSPFEYSHSLLQLDIKNTNILSALWLMFQLFLGALCIPIGLCTHKTVYIGYIEVDDPYGNKYN